MKIIVIGATGTIGEAVAEALREDHEVVAVARKSGDRHADLEKPASLKKLFAAEAPFDAVVCAAGRASFGELAKLDDAAFQLGLDSKLMGQVNVVRLGIEHIADGGSFTLTSGVLAQEPTPGSAAISLVNAAVEGFVRAAALELPRDVRVNVVSPVWVSETLAAMGKDPAEGLPARRVALAYRESVTSKLNGQVLDVREFDFD